MEESLSLNFDRISNSILEYKKTISPIFRVIEESSNIKNVMNIFDDIIHKFLLEWVNYVDPNTVDGDLGDIFNTTQAHELHILETWPHRFEGRALC